MKVKLGEYIQEYSVRNKANEDIPVYSVTNTQGFCHDYFGKEVASKDKKTYKIVPRGYFAYNPSRINVGSVDWQRDEDQVIVSPLYNVFSVSPELNQQYLYYYLKSDFALHRIKAVATGSVRDNLKLEMLKNFPIRIPSISEQEYIIQALDKAKNIINLRKNELHKLDDLIKARFVELFGDPIINSKRLETKPLKEVLVLKAGDFTAASDIAEEPSVTHKYPCYGGNGIRGYVKEYNQDGDFSLVGRQGALSGNVQFASGRFKNTEHALLVTPVVGMNNIWLNQLLLNLELKRYQTGAAQPGLSVKNLQEIPIIMVPMDEQNQFADFVAQIDKSKHHFYSSSLFLGILNLHRSATA